MMITSLMLNEDLEERLPKTADAFPHLACYVEMDRYPGRCVPWHWHPDVEFLWVLQGSLRLSTNNECHLLAAGEGAFINSNRLHYQEPLPGLPVITLNQILDIRLLSGFHKSIYEQKYIDPVLECQELEAVRLCPASPDQRAILEHVRRSYDAADREALGYEFTVRNELSSAWFLLYQEIKDMVETRRAVWNHGEERIKKMLLYIQKHYGERVLLKEIADAASISERECLRCFSQNLGTTPFTYLTEYRIRKAAGELQRTSRPVTEIAYACGFSGTSYFSKTFKKVMGCTPSEYRAMKREETGGPCGNV